MPAISPARAANVSTHAWTKLHDEIMSWISGVYAMHDWLYLKRPAVDGQYKQKPEVATCALTSLWVVNTALGK